MKKSATAVALALAPASPEEETHWPNLVLAPHRALVARMAKWNLPRSAEGFAELNVEPSDQP